jgi:ketosteroid isomerase-like protein
MAEFLTEDALLWGPGMEEVNGRAAILEATEEMFGFLSITDFKIESKEVQLHDRLAYELASYSETLTPKSGQASVVRGRYLLVWKRDPDGRWKVHRNMFYFITATARDVRGEIISRKRGKQHATTPAYVCPDKPSACGVRRRGKTANTIT